MSNKKTLKKAHLPLALAKAFCCSSEMREDEHRGLTFSQMLNTAQTAPPRVFRDCV